MGSVFIGSSLIPATGLYSEQGIVQEQAEPKMHIFEHDPDNTELLALNQEWDS